MECISFEYMKAFTLSVHISLIPAVFSENVGVGFLSIKKGLCPDMPVN